MITKQEFEIIRARVFETLGFEYTGEIEMTEADGAYVKICSGKYIVGASDKSLCARSLMLLAKNFQKENFELLQKPALTLRGVMLDLSRGAVMRVEALKKYMDYMACMGLNNLWMYMEDVYEIEGYPYFGYMRGRYTAEELRKIDTYAYELGIEVIPCIQTLSHLDSYLLHPEAAEIRATENTLLCGEEKTYEFIETLIKTVKGIFRTNRVHIGMDEAFDFCEGEYKKRNGETKDKFGVLYSHLNRVMQICEKYELRPMMWADMFFRLGSPKGAYNDPECVVSEEIKQKIPEVDLVYWDYDHVPEEWYTEMIEMHQALGKKVLFAGGMWTWLTGHMPFTESAFKCLGNGVKACIKKGIKEAVATVWGDDGAECNFMMSLPNLTILSEYCFEGENCAEECIKEYAEFITGIDFAVMDAMSEYHYPTEIRNNHVWYLGMGKRLFYADLLYSDIGNIDVLKIQKEKYRSAAEMVSNIADKNKGEKWEKLYCYVADMFKILTINAEIAIDMRKKYKANDKKYFKILGEETLPELRELYARVYKSTENMWMYTNKVFGWEKLSLRYGRVLVRLEYMNRVINRYANGESDVIEELEYNFIETNDKECGYEVFLKLLYNNMV